MDAPRRIAAVFALVFSCAAALTGCAPTTIRPAIDAAASDTEAKLQRKLAFDNAIAMRRRVDAVAARILTAGADLCGDKIKPRFGLSVVVADSFDEAMRPAARDAGFGDDPAIAFVVPGGPAEIAGLRDGDRLLRAGPGPELPAGKPGVEAATQAFAQAGFEPFPVVVRRAGADIAVDLTPGRACDYKVTVIDKPELNAFADGSSIAIYSGMVKFAAADEELALVVGHELAHNLRGHIDAKRGNAILGSIIDIAIGAVTGVNLGIFQQMGAGANSADFEAEADYVGLYLLARAGYPIDDAPKFWRRMAVENPKAISHTTTHPATNDRFAALTAAIAEIDAKKSAGAPLTPNEAPKPPALPPTPTAKNER